MRRRGMTADYPREPWFWPLLQASGAVELLQKNLEEEILVVEDKQRVTQQLIEDIGAEKCKVGVSSVCACIRS